ncbi:hypothetical protein N7488_003973 [Penicillium malachiteum]|nr:hypothetical protein N7488_003973 [Penicillium malachiteum]
MQAHTTMNREDALAVLAFFEPGGSENAAIAIFVQRSGITADDALDVFTTCPLPLRAPPRLGSRRHFRSALLYVSWTKANIML